MLTFTSMALLLSASALLVHGTSPPLVSCQVKGKTYRHGESWKPDPCTFCVCEDGKELCAVTMCAIGDCPHSFTPEGQCCPMCPLAGAMGRRPWKR
ncbi:hypothetical protein ACEWY4_025111 [Coilia grayii]|uniref:VWFC domain-containing protein n=1 Tax=Coilia grayii TaxID=363190 RepID=A0ABD1IWM3_9TELE